MTRSTAPGSLAVRPGSEGQAKRGLQQRLQLFARNAGLQARGPVALDVQRLDEPVGVGRDQQMIGAGDRPALLAPVLVLIVRQRTVVAIDGFEVVEAAGESAAAL